MNFLVTMSHQLEENLASHQLKNNFMNLVKESSGLSLRMIILKKNHIAQLEEKDDRIQKEKEATNKIIKELQEKLYKIGQSEQTIFLNKPKSSETIIQRMV